MQYFGAYTPKPRFITSGIRDVASLIHVARDPVIRAERVVSGGETIFQDQLVDRGETERCLALVQPLNSLLQRKAVAAASLISALVASFEAVPLQWFVPTGGVTGYWLRSSLHLSLVTDATEQRLMTVVSSDVGDRASNFAGEWGEPEAMFHAQLAFFDVLRYKFPAELAFDAQAAKILEAASSGVGPYGEVKLAKFALNYAMICCTHCITATCAGRCGGCAVLGCAGPVAEGATRFVSDQEKVIKLLSQVKSGLTTSELNREVRLPSADLRALLDSLLASGRIRRKITGTKGRNRTQWML
jgi:hypothetical protein